MMRCRQSRTLLVERVRGAVSPAELLALDEHLVGCDGCRAEQGQLQLLATLRDQELPALTDDAHERVLDALLKARPVPVATAASRGWWALPALRGAALGAAAVLLVLVAVRLTTPPPEPHPVAGGEPAVPVTLALGTRLTMDAPGTLSLGGAFVAYTAGTQVAVGERARTLELVGGEVDVDVTPGGPGHFLVTTGRFRVEVLGTRFIVTPGSVRTLRGHVRVLDLDDHLLADLHAGESWALPIAGPPRHAALVADEPTPELSTPAAAPVATAARAATAARLLAEARRRLVQGAVPKAQRLLEQVDAAGPSREEQAERELLGADALRLSGRAAEAVAAYRQVAEGWPGLGAGESGAFLAGEVLAEQGAAVEARSALQGYLEQYPQGRYAGEVRSRLTVLGRGP